MNQQVLTHVDGKRLDKESKKRDKRSANEKMYRFVLVGTGCSGAVPLCNHLYRGINREREARHDANNSKDNKDGITSIPKPPVKHQLSGSEGPYSSDKDSLGEIEDIQPLIIPDLDKIRYDLWNSNIHEISPSFEVFTRNKLLDFQAETRCRCKRILEGGRDFNKERRNNVSCLLQRKSDYIDGVETNILVDVGKTFRDACLKVLVPLGVTQLDQVIITHAHADACNGIDDLREFQNYAMVEVRGQLRHCCLKPLPIVCDSTTGADLEHRYKYCFDRTRWEMQADGSILLASRWPAYELKTIDTSKLHDKDDELKMTSETLTLKMDTDDVPLEIFPVFHGAEYISLGFGFGTFEKVLYISDVKAINEHVMRGICDSGPWALLVIDCISPLKFHYSHATMYEALHWVRCINPIKVRFVGMTCIFPPVETKELLKDWLHELKETEKKLGRGLCGERESEICLLQELDLGYDGETFEFDLLD